jgi:hypothetical protein
MKDLRQWSRWRLAAAYWSAASLGHLQFSLWLVNTQQTPLGSIKPANYVPLAAALALLALLSYLAWQAYRGSARAVTLAFWLCLASAMLLADLSLTFSANEYFHYPQYALLAWIIARALDPQREQFSAGPTLLIVTLLGAADEVLQYAYITRSYSEYLDFNDIFINLQAAAIGMLLYYGFRQPASAGARRRHARRGALGFILLAGAIFVGAMLLQQQQIRGGLDRLPLIERAEQRYGQWLAGPHRGQYLVLSPALASLLIGVNGVLFSLFPLSLMPDSAPRRSADSA